MFKESRFWFYKSFLSDIQYQKFFLISKLFFLVFLESQFGIFLADCVLESVQMSTSLEPRLVLHSNRLNLGLNILKFQDFEHTANTSQQYFMFDLLGISIWSERYTAQLCIQGFIVQANPKLKRMHSIMQTPRDPSVYLSPIVWGLDFGFDVLVHLDEICLARRDYQYGHQKPKRQQSTRGARVFNNHLIIILLVHSSSHKHRCHHLYSKNLIQGIVLAASLFSSTPRSVLDFLGIYTTHPLISPQLFVQQGALSAPPNTRNSEMPQPWEDKRETLKGIQQI